MFRKLPIIAIFCFLSFNNSTLKAQNFIWANQATVGHYTGNNGLANPVMDAAGNSYICGNYFDSAAFDSFKIFGTSHSDDYNNIFIAKYNNTGKAIWVATNSGTGSANIIQTCTNKSNHIYLLGAYQGTLTFGTTTIVSADFYSSYFVAQLDTAGHFNWIRSYTNTPNQWGYNNISLNSIACDQQDHVYIAGIANGTYNGNGISFNDSLSTVGYPFGVFLSSLSPVDGYANWTTQITGTATKMQAYITTDYNSNVILANRFGGNFYDTSLSATCIFNNIDTLFIPPNNQINKVLISKYTSSGNYLWSSIQVPSLETFSYKINCDVNNNVYYFGGGSNSIDDLNLVKLSGSGQVLWTNPLDFYLNDFSINKTGIYIDGMFDDTLKYQGKQIVQAGAHNIILKIDTISGDLLWATKPLENYNLSGWLSASDDGTVLYCDATTMKLQLGSNLLYNKGDNYNLLALINDTTYQPAANNKITGNVFNDTNSNCIQNPNEHGLGGYTIIAQPGPYYAVTDSVGNYSVKVDSGIYTVQELLPRGHQMIDTQSCQLSGYTVSLPSTNQLSSGNDFGNKYGKCALLNIPSGDEKFFSGPSITMTYNVCNYGTDTAKNVALKVQYPSQMFYPISSSISAYIYNPSDSTLTYNLGDFPPDSCLTITVVDSITYPSSNYGYNELLGVVFRYAAQLTPLNSCYNTDTTYNFAQFDTRLGLPIGVGQLNATSKVISVFPNPTTGNICIDGVSKNDVIELFNVLGQKVTTQISNDSKLFLNLQNQPSGVYFITVSGKDYSMNKKVVKM